MQSYTLEFNGSGEVCEGRFDNDHAAQDWAESILENRGYDSSDLVWADNWDANGQNDDGELCERLLVWAGEEDAQDDPGVNSVAQLTKVGEDMRDVIVSAIEEADPIAPEQVADMCIAAYMKGEDWRKVLADAIEVDRAGGNSHIL